MADEMERDRPPLTEAEYAAMLPSRMQKIADEVNERFADVLPEGIRFEWGSAEDRP